MPSSTATKTIVDWMSATNFPDLPADVQTITKMALYDGIGSILACSMLPVSQRLQEFVRIAGESTDCTIIGSPRRASVLNAALVNGTMGHADEVDAIDDFNTRGSHVLASSMAAALTVGQLVGASGLQVLRGVSLGYELSKRVHAVAARVEEETGRSVAPFDEGNTLGAAAAAAVTAGLPPEQLDVAITLAAHLACGITPFHRESQHMTKSFTRGGMGAKNGATAALMAKAGYDSPREILDGPGGFFHSYLGIQDPGEEFLANLGQDFVMRGLIFKRASSGGGLQAPRQALLELIAQHNLSPDQIDAIQVEMRPGDIGSYFTSDRHPADCGDALALAVLYGGTGFKEAHQERFTTGPEFREMRPRITVQPREDWNDPRFRLHTAVTISTKDGRSLRNETDYRRMTEADLDVKFSHLVGLRAGDAKAQELAPILKGLDQVENIATVMAQLELPEANIEQV